MTTAHKRDRHGFRGVPPPPVFDFDALPDGALLNEYETAAVGRWSTNTLAAWRLREGHGLRCVVIAGGFIRYRVSAIRAFLADAAPRKRKPVKREPRSRATADAVPATQEAGTMTTRRIDEIVVGERHRRDLGDVDGLARSIADLGLLQPIVVTPDGRLIAGARRLAAAKALGWTEIPVNVVDLDAVVKGEFAENAHRKDFTLSEAVAIKRALEPIERAAAKERQRDHGRTAPGRKHSEEVPRLGAPVA